MTKVKPKEQPESFKRKLIGWVAVFIGGLVSGIVVSDFVNYREAIRTTLSADINEFMTSSQTVDSLLVDFTKIVSGDAPLKDEKVEALRVGLISFQKDAHNITIRIPNIETNYLPLEESIVMLIEDATKISTPDKNKKFVQTVAQFKAVSNDFERAAIDAQQKYVKF